MSKRLTFYIGVMAFCLTTGFISGQETIRDYNSGKSFPKEVTVEFKGKNYKLTATGATTRKKFIVKVYSIASYIENPSREGGVQQMLDPTKAKQLTQIFMQNIEPKKLVAVLDESLEKNIPKDQSESLKPVVSQFLGFYSPVKVNDVHEIRWFPGGTVELYINGKKAGSVQNEQFAEALWKIWFGDKSIVNRNELVGNL